MDDLDNEIEELKRKLALDVDARYGLASPDNIMAEKEHFEVWDRMFDLERKKQRLVR